jgi:hypothetical protein
MGQDDQITGETNVGGLVDTAVQIAGKRRETLQRLRTALVNSETTEVYKYAREICGLENDQVQSKAIFSTTHADGLEASDNAEAGT